MKIAILGVGNMGVAYAKSFLKYDLVEPKNLHFVVRKEKKIELLKKEFPKVKIGFLDESLKKNDVVILAVKPQDFNTFGKSLTFQLNPNQIVLSIMAGIKISRIQEVLQHKNVVRAMPNSPSILGMGITGFSAAKEVDFKNLMSIEKLLNSTGRSVFFENENAIDAVTALSGSGPAYFYYIVDAMIKAGISMGIEENVAKLLVKQTMLGAYHLINNSDEDLDHLIKNVASKGGTTEAALLTFEELDLKNILTRGILNAEKRAKELNN